MASVRGDNATLYYTLYEDAGTTDEPTLVLLHGVGGNHASWYQQIAAWRKRFRLLIPDARGFGNSTDPGRLGRDRFIEDLELVLDATQTASAVLIGQSMGGGTALSYTCKHAERVTGLILADTLFGLQLEPEQHARMAALNANNAGLSQIERVLGRTCIASRPDLTTLYTAIASFNVANVSNLTGTQQSHAPAALAETGVPVLFLVGEEDVLFPPTEVAEARATVAGADYVCLERSGHSAYFETPADFNQTIEAWLKAKTLIHDD
ncbi:alpha/beta fold hydrolase [Salinicola peritrichatus]|uniref:alpha/beta fold hydrolase n=1 Tax=Salinicola peritrichatus TaxID=1267424 RepID=UPI0013A64CEA|nr:alpha/beta hydrolase [Salinicola peritrichatus]